MRPSALGLRAAAAALLAALAAWGMGLPRPYWVELTAVVLVDETVGDSARKAKQRLTMTALGCPLGWLLARTIGANHDLLVAMLFLFIFLAVYVRPISVPLLVFFISVYVVFLFAVLGQWTATLTWARLLDTAVGCAIAVLTVLPGWRPSRAIPLDVAARARARALVEASLDGAPTAAALRRALVVDTALRRDDDPLRPLFAAALAFDTTVGWAARDGARAIWRARLTAAFDGAPPPPAPPPLRPFGRAAVVDRAGARLERLARGAVGTVT